MKDAISIIKQIFWQDPLAAVFIALGFLANAAGWGLLYWQIQPTQSSVILHYNIFFGIDRFETAYLQVFEASIGGVVIWLFNLVLGIALYGQVVSEQKKEQVTHSESRDRRYKDKDYFLDYFDAKRLSSYLLWAGALLLQLIILVYIASIIIVNK